MVRKAGKFDPTPQQLQARVAARRGDDVVIVAGAGAGKTSTLEDLAREFQEMGMVGAYTCYNGSTAKEARGRFPRNVECGTAHGFATKASKDRNGVPFWHHRLRGRETGRGFQNGRVLAKILGVTSPIFVPGKGGIEPAKVAELAVRTIKEFCKTVDREVTAAHVPVPDYFDGDTAETVAAGVLPFAQTAWADLRARNGLTNDPGPEACLNVEHDHYLKMWQLSGRPMMVRGPGGMQVPAQFVMLDEAQDANAVMADIFKRQGEEWTSPDGKTVVPPRQLILVGDRNQAINGWNGAIDIMGDFPQATRVDLTRSFRFGPAVAAQANLWLALLGSDLRITGHDPITSEVVTGMADADAILCRTNAGAMRQVLLEQTVPDAIEGEEAPAARRVHLVGNGDEMKALAKAAIDLDDRSWTSHSDLRDFTSWQQVVDHCANGELGSEDIETGVNLIEEFGAEEVVEAITKLVTPKRADVTISTAHKSKGLEWDRVKIGDDFKGPTKDEDGNEVPPGPDELMLSYVAVTRAKLRLDVGSLSWIDAWLAKHGLPVDAPKVVVPAPRMEMLEAPEDAPETPAATAVELAQARVDAATEPLQRAVALLALIEVQARESERDDVARAQDVRAIVEAYLGRDAREALADEMLAHAS